MKQASLSSAKPKAVGSGTRRASLPSRQQKRGKQERQAADADRDQDKLKQGRDAYHFRTERRRAHAYRTSVTKIRAGAQESSSLVIGQYWRSAMMPAPDEPRVIKGWLAFRILEPGSH